jgi:hypothetical protein
VEQMDVAALAELALDRKLVMELNNVVIGNFCEISFLVCVPNCSGRVCGDDGCGGSCGTCAANQVCRVDGACVSCNCVTRYH